jgi:hypothetical protein
METTTDPGAPHLDNAGLQRLLTAVEPAALIVPPRLLCRVIKQHRQVPGLSLLVPHRKSYVIGRDELLRIVTRDELSLAPEHELPATVFLLAGLGPRALAARPRPAVLLHFWRLLFHARVHAALESVLTPTLLQKRIDCLGETEFEEIRAVLQQDGFLLPPEDDHTAYVEFAAVYLELRHFAGPLLPRCFPALGSLDRIDALLAQDLDAAGLFTATRPAGVPDPVLPEDDEDEIESPLPSQPDELPAGESFARYRVLIRQARRGRSRGNVVRAALCRWRAIRVAPVDRRAEIEADLRADLEQLVSRLQDALWLDAREADRWRSALPALLEPAARGVWPAAARLLHDLQKVCVDHERQLYAVDLAGWALSLGRRPIRRPVPCQREVLLLKHLRSALARVKAVPLSERARQRLLGLLEPAVQRCEQRVRGQFRPVLQNGLVEVGLSPGNLPERVALNKLSEQLLDRIVEHGHLSLGDVRDAVSGNQLKLPDLSGPAELLRGDALLRADRKLSHALDGVYHGGEGYLRGLQRLSSLTFGTRPGRFLTRYLALPFGGAFAALVFVEEMLHLVGVHFHLSPGQKGTVVGVLGLFLLLLLHVRAFRAQVVTGLKHGWRGLRALLIDAPLWLVRQPLIRRVLDSPPVVFFTRYLLRPLLAGGVVAGTCALVGTDGTTTALVGAAAFVVAALLFGSRLGRLAEEAVLDWLAHNWHWLRTDVVPGLIRLILHVFKQATEAFERALYAVDEWMRFRSGEGRFSLAAKAVLGLVWFAVTYVVRVVIHLFFEPTVNPIKHFPAVTVAAKLIVPLFPVLRAPVLNALEPVLGRALAETIFLGIFTLLPGLAGFLVWELKENWKLYRSTRSPTLVPVLVGSHGETVLRLLRPGFHSGTLPKLYAKLRRADRHGLRTGDWRKSRKQREVLHHVEESVSHFVERELVFLLSASQRWEYRPPTVGAIELATNRIRVGLYYPLKGEEDLVLSFDLRKGQLEAGIAAPGWLAQLSPPQTEALLTALAGLYKLAGVDRVRELAEPPAFGESAISWEQWVTVWEQDQQGKRPAVPLLDVTPARKFGTQA